MLSSSRSVGSAKFISLTLDLEMQLVPSLRPFSAAFRILIRSRLPKMDNRDGVPAVVQMKLSVGFKLAASRNNAAKQNKISLFKLSVRKAHPSNDRDARSEVNRLVPDQYLYQSEPSDSCIFFPDYGGLVQGEDQEQHAISHGDNPA